MPEDGPERAVTLIEHEGEPLAVLVHDPTLREEPKLVEAVAAAARLALVNARLHAEVRAQLETVQESRARIVTAADEERRRIERDLHDGAQQRLVALALELRSAQRQLGGTRRPRARAACSSSTADELQVAVEELRELAQGIHPGILTQGGLAHALEAAGSAGAAPRDGGRDGGAVRARGRGDRVLRRLRGAHERREARRRVEGVDRREAGQRPRS